MRYTVILICCLFASGCATLGPVTFSNSNDLLKAASQIQLGDTRNEVVCYLGWRKDQGSLEARRNTEKDGGELVHPHIAFWRWQVYPVSLYVEFTSDGQVYRIHYSDDKRKPDGPYTMLGPDYSKHANEYIGPHSSQIKKQERVLVDSWDLAVESLMPRGGIPAGTTNLETVKKVSRVQDVSANELDFRIVELNWLNEAGRPIRNQNGLNFVFQIVDGKYKLVGGFHGSYIHIVEYGDQILALAYYHVSAAGNPPIIHPFVDGMFNTAEGDLTK